MLTLVRLLYTDCRSPIPTGNHLWPDLAFLGVEDMVTALATDEGMEVIGEATTTTRIRTKSMTVTKITTGNEANEDSQFSIHDMGRRRKPLFETGTVLGESTSRPSMGRDRDRDTDDS